MKLEKYLRNSGLCGRVGTPSNTILQNILKMLQGDLDYTFGMDDWASSNFAEASNAVNTYLDSRLEELDLKEGIGSINASRTAKDFERQRKALHSLVGGGSRVLLATGHPTGLLEYYGRIAEWCLSVGSELVMENEHPGNGSHDPPGGIGWRYVNGVGCVYDGRNLLHTHRALLMESLLDSLSQDNKMPDLVIADHGLAGAAITRGVPTLAIADINDPALPLANFRGQCETVAMIDDNLPPKTYDYLAEYMTT